MAIRIRTACLSDLEDIVDIYNFAIEEGNSTCDTSPIRPEQWSTWLSSRIGSHRPIWVAETVESSVSMTVGYLGLSHFMNERPGYYKTSDMGVYIHPKYQGRGVASYLLQNALHEAPALGIDTFATTAFAHNSGSLKLFEKFGFEQWGYFPKVASVKGREFDLVMLGLHLNPEPEN